MDGFEFDGRDRGDAFGWGVKILACVGVFGMFGGLMLLATGSVIASVWAGFVGGLIPCGVILSES